LFFGPETGAPGSQMATALAEEGLGRATISLGYNCLCVETDSGRVLIDTGLGPKFGGYGGQFTPQVGKLDDGLAEAGISPSDVDAVVFTHFHRDHVRGAVWSGEPMFAGARHIVNSAEVAFWKDATEARAGGADADSARQAIRLLDSQLSPVAYDTEILGGVRTVVASGHTPGHMAILLSSRDERLLCVGDSFYDRIQLRRPGWWTPYDLNPPESVASRRRLLARAADESLPVHAYHMPFPGLGRINRRGAAFEWIELNAAAAV
jgi:glyoxylase-like metal-dependent hydrolase (beta-lactamase superfamily II)